MEDLLAASRRYGSDPKWVVAGGGNTSLKDGDTLYVKASGYPLATIGEDGFARMDRQKLDAIWSRAYPTGDDEAAVAERERLVLADMMDARQAGESRRPSVETLLHDLLPWPLVVHLHPTLVNGLTCGRKGPEMAEEIFGTGQCWIPLTDPGYVLAKTIRDALTERRAKGLTDPEYIFLANHGVFVGGENLKDVEDKYDRLSAALEKRLIRRPSSMPSAATPPLADADTERTVRSLFGEDGRHTFLSGGELDRYLKSAEAAAPLTGCLTPDHIVYAGPGALFIDENGKNGNLAETWLTEAENYRKEWGKPPNIILLRSTSGAFVAASGQKALENAVLLLENALEVSAFTESFGGVLPMEEAFVRFIVNWEVENYRSKLASG